MAAGGERASESMRVARGSEVASNPDVILAGINNGGCEMD